MTAATADLGTIVKAVGRKGEVKLLPGPDFWLEAFQARTFTLLSENSVREVHVEGFRAKGNAYILKLAGFETIDDAESIVGSTLNVSLDALDESALPKQLMPFQLMGRTVRLSDGTPVGKVVDMLLGTVQRCLIVEKGEERFLIPDAPGVIVNIDGENGAIEIDPPEGLLDLRW
jgi:16S rRNA processing protein RimM